MGITKLFKLEKLKIEAYGNHRRLGLPQKTLKVMFNPASFTMRHENKFGKLPAINTSEPRGLFSHGRSQSLELELIFDGTGVSDTGLLTLVGQGSPSVTEQIEEFLEACFYMDGKLHEPKYLTIRWGTGPLAHFECRLDSAQITYTAFDKSGAPLRAKLDTKFTRQLAPEKRVRKEGKNSPDLSHHRVVRAGDTLPLLCREIYGSPHHYLFVARANRLDDFRNLRPGQELAFPPLTTEGPPSPSPA